MPGTHFQELEEVEKFIQNLERSFSKIKNEMERADLEAKVFLLKLKHERMRAMAAVEKSRSILANMEFILAKTEIGHAVSNLGSNSQRDFALKKKSGTRNEASSLKKKRLAAESHSATHNSKRRSRKTYKENCKKDTSPKKPESKTQLPAWEPPQKSNKKECDAPSISENSVPCSIPMQNLTNHTWPESYKKMIYLENPPVRDTKVNKNIGYYTTAYAHEVLGYNPETLEKNVYSQFESFDERPQENQQICVPQVNPVNLSVKPATYNLLVKPGYNLDLMPEYLMQHQAQVHHSEELNNNQNACLNNYQYAHLPPGNNFEQTNKLYRELMYNEQHKDNDNDIHSMASEETLVITMNLEGFQNSTPEF